jgi:hypothetical protein
VNAEQDNEGSLNQEIERRRTLIMTQRLKQCSVGATCDVKGQPGFVQTKRRISQEGGEPEDDASSEARDNESIPRLRVGGPEPESGH